MQGLHAVVDHLKNIPPDFFGQVIVRIKQGKAVLITEERTLKVDDTLKNRSM